MACNSGKLSRTHYTHSPKDIRERPPKAIQVQKKKKNQIKNLNNTFSLTISRNPRSCLKRH